MDPVSNLEVSNFAIMPSNWFFQNVAILRQRACFRQPTCLFPPATPETEHCAPHFVADYIINTVCTNNSRRVYTNVVTRVGGSVGRLNPTTVVQMYRSK